MNTLWQRLIVYILVAMLAGCSVSKVVGGERMKDLSVLKLGTYRHVVVGELGTPILSEKNEEGYKVDLFKFVQGRHGGVKASKALVYGSAAVLTLGLSELIANPLEAAGGEGAEMQLRVQYDEEQRVKQVDVFKDDRWFPVQQVKGSKL